MRVTAGGAGQKARNDFLSADCRDKTAPWVPWHPGSRLLLLASEACHLPVLSS